MKKVSSAIVLGACVLGFALSAYAVLADDLVIKKYDFDGYDRIEVEFPFEIEIKKAAAHQAIVEIDKDLAKSLKVTRQGSTLRIHLEPGGHSVKGSCCGGGLKARIFLPKLVGLKLNTAATAVIEKGFGYVESFDLELTAASSVKGHLKVGKARFEISAASTVDLEGSARQLDLDLSAASTAKLSDFVIRDTRADVSGASHAKLNVTGKLDADVSGCSTLRYGGNPRVRTLDASGLSTISKI